MKEKTNKKCTSCKEIKDFTEFHKTKRNNDGHNSVCKNCRSLLLYGKPHHGTISEFNLQRKVSKEYEDGTKLCLDCNQTLCQTKFPINARKTLAPRCRECCSYRRLMEKYGLTKEVYLKMLENQNYCCKICKNKEIYYDKLVVDHCHNSGEVRGLLCNSCNQALGFFKDNLNNMKEAVKYLENYTELN
jgi:hypothetical protein